MSSQRNKLIAKNTLMLYFRQLLILLVALYTIRIVLHELGVNDYGIYIAVGGLVALGSFLPGALAQATQRFFSFALGEQNDELLKKTFTVNVALYLSIAFIAYVLMQTIGLWFVNNQLSVPGERFEAAKALYHYATLTFVVNILATPFMSIIIAHEDMKLYAYISIFEALMKLGVVFLLQFIEWDKLELYALLIMCVSFVNLLIYAWLCLRRYSECQFSKIYWDKALFVDNLGFIGWTLFGQISTIARTHAITVLLNQAFSPAVVAARAISVQIASKVNIFSGNFNTSLYPPIIKSYASNEMQSMYELINGGAKITFFLLWIFALPMMFEMRAILEVWLTVVPTHTVFFSQLALVEALIFSVSMPLTAAARAPGNMKVYELTLGSIQIVIFIFALIVIINDAPAYSVFIVAIIANILMFGIRLYLVNRLIGFPIGSFIKNTLVPVLAIITITTISTAIVKHFLPAGFYWSLLLMSFSMVSSIIAMYFIGLDKPLKQKIIKIVFTKLNKVKH